ncbi:UDP-4-amino-4,6-dideoxy-N-acetyl-beta-L-altrosamine N-acetyltransferase [Tenuibacillus multivorans]|uniref:UDP-4-amino-4,6-dideoxy-N-acetyl-beta-L-altrosamine N-acetyltransferase n=1 Tax=Tenuibacillus multivorans TaxID=237069 RepID=A0A1G9YNA7_9BACI|nr:UDP-4-amino-4,6-dideoxy-N-acetyl-beta-L-altrosamine N-acetyltransferase [Tenuibacillus multivorans]GEL78481.1 hypothetical protein TMU01_27160 [Tenuibacillus multivorans]SDN10517.1 UDP-4-amino-4,6-dideoxy-N-acetyl-beta-L-altrosamine N-acetyltransferase [Tenuibacillus multivorans]
MIIDLNAFYLEALSEPYLEKVLEWRNSEPIRSVMYSDHLITWDDHYAWYQRISTDDTSIVRLLFYNEKPVGLVNFSNIDRKNCRCFWGFYIGEANAPKKSGTVMGLLALDMMFEDKNLNKICAEVIESNPKSLHYHKKLGFEEEGLFKKHILKNNQWMDITRLALFREQWKETRGNLLNYFKGGT